MRFVGQTAERRRRVGFDDFDLAIAGHELEDFLDLRARRRGPQRAGPADIRAVGLDLRQMRQRIGLGDEIELAELAQLAQDVERLVGLPQHLGLRPEHDAERVQAVSGVGRVEVVDTHRHEVEPLEVGRRRLIVAVADGSTPISRSSAARHSLPWFGGMASPERDIVTRSESTSFACNSTSMMSCVAASLPLPHGIEHGLEHMGEVDELLEAENARAALDRMNARGRSR